jgi:ornithine cyclodeaminase
MAGVKWYDSNTANSERHGWPRSIHLVIINNPEYGYPLAIMDVTLISAMRTGAVPAIGAKYLARGDSEIISLIGAGVINRAVISCLNERALGLDIKAVDSLKEAVDGCDVIDVARLILQIGGSITCSVGGLMKRRGDGGRFLRILTRA